MYDWPLYVCQKGWPVSIELLIEDQAFSLSYDFAPPPPSTQSPPPFDQQVDSLSQSPVEFTGRAYCHRPGEGGG